MFDDLSAHDELQEVIEGSLNLIIDKLQIEAQPEEIDYAYLC